MQRNKVETVVFDFGNTLIDERIFLSKALEGLMAALQKRASNIDPAWAAGIWHRAMWDNFTKYAGHPPRDREWRVRWTSAKCLLEVVAGASDDESVMTLMQAYIGGAALAPALFPNTREVLSELRGRGYRLVLLSNGFAPYTRQFLLCHGLVMVFDDVLISEEVNLEKPDPTFFRRAVADGTAIMVGNKLHEDIAGGQSAGMTTVWFRHDEPQKSGVSAKPDYVITAINDVLQLPCFSAP